MGRKATAPFEANTLLDRERGCDGTPFYVTKEEKLPQQDRIDLLDRQIRDNRNGKRGIVVKLDEHAQLYKVYFLKNDNFTNRKKLKVKGCYDVLTLSPDQMQKSENYEIGGYDPAWKRSIIFAENAERREHYKSLTDEEKREEKLKSRSTKTSATIMKAKSSEAPISSRIYEPPTYRQAMACDDRELWKSAIKKELEGLMTMGVLEIIKPRSGIRTIDSKFVFKVKYNPDSSVDKYKARYVCRGDRQRPGLDFDINKIFAPVANQTLARLIFSIAARHDLEMDMVDVSQAYLYAGLEEENLVMKPASGVTDILGIEPDSWFRLKRSLYGLRQAGYNWFREFNSWIREQGFNRCNEDDCLYVHET